MSMVIVYSTLTGQIELCTNAGITLEENQATLEVDGLVRPSDWVVDLETLELLPAPVPEVPRADRIRKQKWDADIQAGIQRRQLGSQGDGQATIYLLKRDEALRYLADPSPQAQAYPFLSAEVGITGPNMTAVANKILAAHNRWIQGLVQIESARLQAKKDAEDLV
jgi:hypothetical protein